MEKKEWAESVCRVFERLVRDTLWGDFTFPAGGRSVRLLEACFDRLEKKVITVSGERLADFCICQVYTISGFEASYRKRWDVSHSFGQKAVSRFLQTGKQRRFYEDKWLKSFGISRTDIYTLAERRKRHPFTRFVFPEYEEVTKRRLLSSETGYLICGNSTLLWTPFSPSCQRCRHAASCRLRTAAQYPELYRLRCEMWNEKEECR